MYICMWASRLHRILFTTVLNFNDYMHFDTCHEKPCFADDIMMNDE